MHSLISQAIDQINNVLLGKDQQVKLAVACLLARGHLLIEDLPGMGKTTLSQCLAAVLGLKYKRVQFTSDLLPADILGVSVFNRQSESFHFHPGPIFTQILLADEINRTTPKTQSALLEAMEEGQVTIEGETRPLDSPFFVIATQNPIEQMGTYLLPESQLDRFLMRISLGYPSSSAERLLFEGKNPRQTIQDIKSVLTGEQLLNIQKQVPEVKASKELLNYFQALVNFTREDKHFQLGLSPRGALAWLNAAKAWAIVQNRDYVLPEDVQVVLPAVVGHRVRASSEFSDVGDLSQYLLKSVNVLAA